MLHSHWSKEPMKAIIDLISRLTVNLINQQSAGRFWCFITSCFRILCLYKDIQNYEMSLKSLAAVKTLIFPSHYLHTELCSIFRKDGDVSRELIGQ